MLRLLSMPRNVFLFTFLFTLTVGLIAQLIIIPHIPSIDGGHGLLIGGDAIGYHQIAIELLERMRAEGWAAWDLPPNGWAPSGMAAAIYYLTGISEPYVLMPLNALLYAFSAYFLMLTMNNIRMSSFNFVCVMPLVFFPSNINIYGQITKDSFTSLSVFMLLHIASILFLKKSPRSEMFIYCILSSIIACVFLWVFRPYLIKLILVGMIPVVISIVIFKVRDKSRILLSIIALLAIPIGFVSLGHDNKSRLLEGPAAVSDGARPGSYAPNPAAPLSCDNDLIFTINEYRQSYFNSFPDAGSNVDKNIVFCDFYDVIKYIPRSAILGLFAPFPNMWGARSGEHGGKMMKLISAAEMIASYVIYLGIPMSILLSRTESKIKILSVISFSIIVIGIYTFVIPNIGTIYRMRHPYWLFLLSLGILGWMMLFTKMSRSRSGGLDQDSASIG